MTDQTIGNDVDSDDQWIFSEEEVKRSPSVEHGISSEDERIRRAKGVNFLGQAGLLLQLPPHVLGSAAVFFHRFYMRCSMVPEKGGIHHYSIAATALFLATKATEHNRKTKEVIIAVARTAQKNSNIIIDEQSKEFWKWKDNILAYEETMLELLTFDVLVKTPYNTVANFLEDQGWLPSQSATPNREVRDRAWAFANDSNMTVLCLLMPAEEIGVAAIYFSLHFAKTAIPDDEQGRPWWSKYGGTEKNLHTAVRVMHAFYSDNPLNKPDPPDVGNLDSINEDLERSRRRADNSTPRTEDMGIMTVDSRDSSTVVRDETVRSRESYVPPKLSEKTTNGHLGENTQPAKRNSTETQPTLGPSDNAEPGDSDAVLKVAANDPATHTLPTNISSTSNGVKRAPEDLTESNSPSKRVRIVSPAPPTGSSVHGGDASEEGEV